MTEIIIAVAAKVSEYLVAPIGRQLSYLFCYGGHMDDLNKKVQELGLAKDDLQITVDEAIRRGDEIRPIVQDWLTRADKNTGEAKKFMEDEKKRTKSCFNGWCPNLKSRYLLSREAYEKAQVIDKVQEDRKFPDGVAYCVPLRNVTFKNYEPFESRASTVNKVMDALRADEINKIGVWGMGGVGKTTLVKQVSQLAEDEKLFITRVYVDVSWTRDSEKLQDGIAKIQQKIADMLGLEFKGKDESTRAAELKQRLQKEKILIILDDIWKEVSLEEVGIPSKDDQKGCKIVMASRNEDLLRKDMGAKECFPLQHLPEKEAWNLFKKTAGDSVEGDKLQHIAIEVVNECGGLPIAIVTIANALKGECVAIWENALDELRSAAPTNISGVDDKVYGCLKWSYDHLKGDEVKSLFLLCGWLSYGDISMHQLLQYAMGLDLFDHINSLEKARNKLVTLVRTLKASSLLLDGEDHRNGIGGASRLLFMDADNKSVRMHDVVRDVARNIASKDPHRFVVREHDEEWSKTDGSKYISLNCEDVHELPHRLVCPELQFLLLQNISPTLNIPHTFFEGMNLLKVLDLSEMHFTTLPSTLHSLPNLRTLRLDRCKLGDIALIGELKKLQVLSMVGSDIQQLPSEMGQLTNLRLLDLNDCWELDVIPRNILSSLSRLECLCMKRSFTQWAAEGVSDGESNACLSELNHLRHLTTIEIQVPAVELLPKEDMFFENLTRYAIFDGSFYSWERKYKTSKQLKLRQVDLLLRDGIGKLLKKTEDLELSNLEEVCRGPIPPRSLDNLKTLHVEECHGLKFLFLLSRGLSQLEEMTIKHCNAMQQIITWEGEFEIKEVDHVGTDLQLLPKLQFLKLRDLPELMNFDYFGSNLETASQGMCSQGNPDIHMPFFSYQVSFPNLEKLILHDLPKLREIWHHQLPLGSFNNLKILKVQNCQGLFNLIPSHLIQRFDNLKELEVNNCEVLKHVFDLQGLDRNIRILPRLEFLKLNVLPKLRRVVCNEDEDKNDSVRCLFSSSTAFQNLKFLSIKYCGYKVEDEEHISTPKEDVVLFDGKVSFPNLEKLILHYLPKLREIWHHQHPPESFYNLQILEVYNCPSLLNLIPSHLIQRFDNLKKLEVDNCEVLKHVFDLQGLDGNIRILPRLESLKLNELPKLRRVVCNEDEDKNDSVMCLFFSSTAFQNLKFLYIKYCGYKVEDEEHISTPKEDVVLFDGKVSFSNLEKLILHDLPKLREIWHHQLPLVSFYNLQILKVYNCPGLLNLIPSHLIQSLDKLKEMVVDNCEVLKHVFDFQGLDGNIRILPRLESLRLEALPKLRRVVCNEDDDKNDSVRCRFSSSTAFHNLKFLSITNCGNQVEDEGHINTPMEDVVLFDGKVSFSPNLEELVLERLSKLKEMDIGIFLKLKILKLEKLPRLRLTVASMFKNFHNLQKLHIIDCGMEDEQDVNTPSNDVVFSNEKVSFPLNLEELVLKNLPNLIEMDVGILPKLKILKLKKLHGCLLFKVSFPPNLEELVLKSLPKLTEIDVENLSKLKILKLKELHGRLLFKVSFPPNLEELVLKSLPKLMEMDVGNLPNLRILRLEQLHECLLSKVSFPNLEKLILHDLPKLREIWHHQLPLGSFYNLQILQVYNCQSLLNLISSHLIQNFHNLKELEVVNCEVLKHVFDLQGLDGNIRILPRLESLQLEALPKLSRVVCNEDDDKNDSVRCLFSSSTAFHNLKFLSIKDCGNKVEDEEHINTPTENVVLFDGKVAFPTLEALDISNLDNVEKIWHNEIIADSFGKLKRLSVGSCQKLQNVIPSNVLKTIPTLQNLKIVECNLLEEVFDLKSIDSKQSHDIPALQLQELCLDNLKNLKYVWNEAPQGLLTYQNLKSVQVSHCPSLQIPFPGYVVRSLLQVNEVDMNSRRVKEIVAHEDIAKAVTMFIFPEVTSLTNSCPKELTRFYLGLHTLEWPMLKTLEVESCESLQMLASKLDKSVESPIFLCDKVTFPNLEVLSLSLKLKEIQDLQVLFGALPNLKTLMVENCPYLLSLFSPQFIQCINNLKKLTVKNCGLLEEVFDLKGLDHGDVEPVEMLSQLEEVSLIDLPKLRYICNDIPPKVLCFQNLKSLHVEQCSSVTHLLSPSMVLGLVQLQDLRIEHCPVMKEIFTVEGKDTDNWPRYVSCFQNLKSLQVKQCDSLMYLFPYSVALGLEQFQDLRIEHCSKMKEIIMEDGDMGNRPRQVSSLQKLKFVRVKQCDSLMYLFSHFMALGLVQLQDLCIEDCPMMTEIVTAEDRDFDNQAPLVSCFKNLTSVQVKQCDRLSHEGVTDEIIFPQITSVSLLKLPLLTSFYLSRTLERIHVGGFNKVPGVLFKEEVALPNLEFLYVSGLDKVKKIWHNQLLANSFSKLKEMKVENCNELQNISTANVLNWLPSLEFLRIASCGKLQEVFDLDVTNVQEDITDNRLSKLVLDDLQNPEHICDKVLGKKLCLQNLKFLEVSKCGSMKKLFSPYTELERVREIIRQEEGAEEVIDKIDFPELTSLSLESLPSLTSFYPGSHTLRRVGPGDHDILITVLFNEKVAFPSLLSLHISGLDDIKEIWNNNRTANSFSRLEKVKVEYCNKLQNGLPLFVLKWLSSLQFLRIANCGKLEEVFDLEGADILDDETETQLNKLELHDLPLLQYIWNRDPYGILTYENLDLVEVLRCQVLKGQFPSCLTRDLSQLEKQLIRSRWKKDLEGKEEGEDFVFPEVTYDKLDL